MKSVPLITGGLSFLLSACSGGGGSFDVDDVSNPSSSKPRYQDDTSNQRTKSNLDQLSIPSLGGGMKLVASNIYPNASREPSLLNDHVILTGLSSIKNDIENNKKNGDTIGSIEEPNGTSQNSNSQKYVYSGLYYINSWTDYSKRQEKKAYSGYYGYAFYYGNKTATDLPVDGVAKYKGTWDFITATEYGKRYSLLSNSGSHAYSRRSAIPEDIDLENDPKNGREKGLVSEFSADFGTKKLTGKLFYTKRQTNNQNYKKEELYDIDANIYSNRFRGKVKPTQKDSTDHPFTSEGTLEGGFYGPNGEELGGKFLANDEKVFGVFSAKETEETKQKTENKKLLKETLIDGKLTTFKRTDATTNATASTTASTAANTTTDVKTDEKNFKTEDIPSFGEADYLLIDNYPVPLFPEENTSDFATSKLHKVGDKTYQVEACCSNLSYVKFGMYYEAPPKEEEKDKEKKEKQTTTTSINTYYQFLLGHRTPKDDIPKEGSAKYLGSWFGYLSDGSTSYSTSGDKERSKNAVAEFDVNFAEKKLTGELKRHDNGNTVFKINAELNGSNDFTGTATATNFVIDGNNSQTSNAKINITTKVNGAFYGPKASELGGYFTYNGKNPTATNSESSSTVPSPPNSPNASAAVVFGAKKQVETTNK
ncbi:transferrin-binding protein-like solute binding protein [Haemophilus influenzae]|uniref:transferrin-binding protein-like solute binding protein n=1 Tax=Haemophilus influenzae TaxID=727 RepID=UPI001F1A27D5|nr:transferrin-binding protein-like solute binding protein [Haemophilus influenzae]MCK9061355.1 transferrin-binding protein-like solute binding protein [Haemophilus influenzae]MCK9079050.1 transferrin-binding protein-like solute binding protein [Haemophilus influenzae]